MKFVCIALLGLVLAAGVSAQSREEQCQAGTLPEGYYAHETYCNVFFSCSLTYWREYQCYGDGVWNPAAEACDYATNVNCGGLVRISEVMIVLKIPPNTCYLVPLQTIRPATKINNPTIF